MSINFGDAIGKGFRFAINLERFALMYVFQLIVLSSIGLPMLKIARVLIGAAPGGAPPIIEFVYFGLWIFAVLVFSMLVGTFISVTLVESYYHKTSIVKSMKKAKKYYWRALGVVIIVAIISGLAGLVPYFGAILSIIVGIVFLFIIPIIIIDKYDLEKTLSHSWKTFKKHKLDFFLVWLLHTIIAGVIAVIFAIPFIALIVVSVVTTKTVPTITMGIVLAGLVALVGISLTTLFGIGFLTESYMQLKKKK